MSVWLYCIVVIEKVDTLKTRLFVLAVVAATDHPKSVRNRAIALLGGVFVLSRCFLDFSVV